MVIADFGFDPRGRDLSSGLAVRSTEFRNRLAELMSGDQIVQVSNHGSIAGYWVPWSAAPSDASQREAQARARLMLSTLAQVTSPESIQEELADLEAHRNAGGFIE